MDIILVVAVFVVGLVAGYELGAHGHIKARLASLEARLTGSAAPSSPGAPSPAPKPEKPA